MTVRNLDALFKPKAITLIGASNRPRSVGAVLARNLFEAGFRGPILTVNPHEQAIRSTLNYRSVADLPITPDLAVLVDAAGNHAWADRRARGARMPRRRRGLSRVRRGPPGGRQGAAAAHAGCRTAAPVAHRRAELPRLHLAAVRHQRELRPCDPAGRQYRLRHPIGRGGHRPCSTGRRTATSASPT